MKKCPFWSHDEMDKECFNECIMNKGFNNDEECIFLEYLDDANLEKTMDIDIMDEVALDME
ncbi:MAG: hypothetical protein ACRC28_18225 [Clostridium sp.]|uniref:hypothetical protein n=1 Tax=Clostridium sp. TaxID=1506 RepID=UPI003F34C51E